MKHGRFRASSAVVALSVLVACDLEPSPLPPIPAVDIALDFCSDDIPVWIAYQQLGQNWVRLTPDADGTVRFTAEYKVAMMFVYQNGADTRTEAIYLTSNVLEAVSGQACREQSGTKNLNGSVLNFSGSERALVGMGQSSVYRQPGQNTFTLANLPTRPLDLMASRMSFVGATEQHANKTILRRSQNLVSGSTIPALDFNTTEAITPTTANVAVSGVSPDDFAYLANNFFSQLETTHLLTYVEPVTNTSYLVEALPASVTAAGDYHDVFVTAVSPAGHSRGVERFFRTPGSHTLVVGPDLSAPVISDIATQPYLRVRTLLPWQGDYPSSVSVVYQQQTQFSANTYTLTVTAGYLGILGVQWDLPMDDMTGAPGWQNSWGLQNGAYSWTVTAFGARNDLLLGAPPLENELVRYGVRISDPTMAARILTAPPRPAIHALRMRR